MANYRDAEYQKLKVVIDPELGLMLMTAEGKKIAHGPVTVTDDQRRHGIATMTVVFSVMPGTEVEWGE